jgi:hypothetical protein
MGATCSESGLKAMSAVMDMDGRSVVHTVDGQWLMQEYPVEVTHARQRPLSLLERFVLQAFNDINGCTARDIITQFGLAPLLVESTLRTLKLCNVVDSVDMIEDINSTNDDHLELQRELKEVLDRLTLVGTTKEQQEELLRQRDILQTQLQELKNVPEMDSGDRYGQMKYNVNALGKEALLNKHLKEPTETKIYSFLRCMSSGNLHLRGGPSIDKAGIEGGWPEPNTSFWSNEPQSKFTALDPTINEVEQALTLLNSNDEIEINSIEILDSRYEEREVYAPLHFTLTMTQEEKRPEWFVHLEREHLPRVRWIEDQLHNVKTLSSDLTKHLANSLPPVKGMNPTSVKNASPLVRMDRLFGQEASHEGILVVNEHERLTKMVDLPLPNLDRLLTTRTMVCLSSKLKKDYQFDQTEELSPPNFTIPGQGIPMNPGTIAMNSGFFETGFISITVEDGYVYLPVLCHSGERGLKLVVKVDTSLRKLLNSEHCFLMTGAPADLNDWIQDMVANISFKKAETIIPAFIEIRDRLHETANPLGLTYMHQVVKVVLEAYSSNLSNSEKAISEMLISIEQAQISQDEKGQCWKSIESFLYTQAIEGSTSGKDASDLMPLWQSVRHRKAQLSWEEMASLENTLLGNCSWTRFEINRHMERLVKDLAVGNQRTVSDLAGMMNDLQTTGVINKELHAELKKTKAGRNIFTHGYDLDADLKHTLEAIKTLRLLATLTDPIDDPRWNKPQENRDFAWNFSFEELNQYITYCFNIMKQHGKTRDFTQSLWVDGLNTRLPASYPFIPFAMIDTLDSITSLKMGLDGQLLKQRVLKDASSNWEAKLEAPDNYLLPDEVLTTIYQLTSYGLEKEAKQIAKSLLARVPLPSSIEALLNEVNLAEETLKQIPRIDAIIRWKRTIEAPDFASSLHALSIAEEESLERMGKDLNKKLLKDALEVYFGSEQDLQIIESGIVEVSQFISKNPEWTPTLNSLEGLMLERCKRQLNRGSENEKIAWLERITKTTLADTSLGGFKKKLDDTRKDIMGKKAQAKKQATKSKQPKKGKKPKKRGGKK